MLRIPLRVASYSALALLGGAIVAWTLRSSLAASPPAALPASAALGAEPTLPQGPARAPRAREEGLPLLPFAELIHSGPELRPSDKAQGLSGHRVRLVGYMAELEEPMTGAFYLVPQPIHLDESGGGTGDLPLQTILVDVPGAAGKTIPHVRGPLEGIGVFEVGNRADDQGRVSNFRLHLDPDDRLTQGPKATPTPTEQHN